MKKIKKFKRWLYFTLFIFVFLFTTYGSIHILARIIPLGDLDEPTHIEFYDKDDELIASFVQGQLSEYLEYEEINPLLVMTFVQVEDKNFFKHGGLDYLRILKALFINVKTQEVQQGGSTITQQVARTLYLDLDKTYSRKIEEAFKALQIEKRLDKNKIMEIYLNTVFFGGKIYGIERASQYYFHKKQKDLNLSEATVIAGLLNAPNTYLEDDDNHLILQRQKNILETMYKSNKITYEQYQEALSFSLIFYKNEDSYFDYNLLYYFDATLQQLSEGAFYNIDKYRKGIKIYTNLDLKIYEMINNAMQSQQDNLSKLQASIITMEPYSNKVTALLGGKDYLESSFNRPINSYRQIGSTIKPLLYYLALINGFNPLTQLYSGPTTFHIEEYGDYSPNNYGNLYPNRKINMLEAIAMSDNIYAVKTGLYIGNETLGNGLSFFTDVNEILPSLSLGVSEMSLLQLCGMYNMFASEGVYYAPQFIRKVLSYEDETIFEPITRQTRLLTHPTTLVLNQMLRAPFDKNLSSYGTPTMVNYQTIGYYGAKSGSTNSDNYVMAYNPLITMGIWCGSEEGKNIEASNSAKVLFRLIAHQVDLKIGIKWYTPTASMLEKKINPITGINDNNGSIYYFF